MTAHSVIIGAAATAVTHRAGSGAHLPPKPATMRARLSPARPTRASSRATASRCMRAMRRRQRRFHPDRPALRHPLPRPQRAQCRKRRQCRIGLPPPSRDVPAPQTRRLLRELLRLAARSTCSWPHGAPPAFAR